MTCIVSPTQFPSKKVLREVVAADPQSVDIEDPSIFNPRYFTAADIRPGESVVVTNHPKRSWFAAIERLQDGRLRVK